MKDELYHWSSAHDRIRNTGNHCGDSLGYLYIQVKTGIPGGKGLGTKGSDLRFLSANCQDAELSHEEDEVGRWLTYKVPPRFPPG